MVRTRVLHSSTFVIRLHYSNQLERLVEPLARSIDLAQRARPLEPVTIVVPNRALEQFIKYRVAEQLGVAANLRFPFLRGYLAELDARASDEILVLEASDLALVLYEC
ncbi:MAG TPA: exodeoxyribonuclease V subunit gamma, partial [Candidatus Binataceae bacterium]|nr:exodeoxyribonuclease V subunit gamma [Candidatus Binataceae bacterium]